MIRIYLDLYITLNPQREMWIIAEGFWATLIYSVHLVPFNQVEVWTCNTLILFFLHQKFCCRFPAVLGIIVLLHDLFQTSFSLTFLYRGVCGRLIHCTVPWSCGCTITPPSSHLIHSDRTWYEVFILICCVWFSSNMALCSMAKHLHFSQVYPKNSLLEVLWFIEMQLCKPNLCFHVLSREKTLSPGCGLTLGWIYGNIMVT